MVVRVGIITMIENPRKDSFLPSHPTSSLFSSSRPSPAPTPTNICRVLIISYLPILSIFPPRNRNPNATISALSKSPRKSQSSPFFWCIFRQVLRLESCGVILTSLVSGAVMDLSATGLGADLWSTTGRRVRLLKGSGGRCGICWACWALVGMRRGWGRWGGIARLWSGAGADGGNAADVLVGCLVVFIFCSFWWTCGRFGCVDLLFLFLVGICWRNAARSA